MFFVHLGKVQLTNEYHKTFFYFSEGDNFGNAEMFSMTRRNGNASPVEDSLLYHVHKSKLESVLDHFPKIKISLVKDSLEL